MLPILPGVPEKQTHDYVRNGTTTLFAALEVATGRVEQLCQPRHRHQEFLRFLKQVAKAYPRRRLHIVCDNYATHKHDAVTTWLARNRRITLHFTPTSGSWLNLVEVFFGIITRQAIRRGTFGSVRELIEAITAFIDGWNERCQPFVWTKDADTIIAKANRKSTSATRNTRPSADEMTLAVPNVSGQVERRVAGDAVGCAREGPWLMHYSFRAPGSASRGCRGPSSRLACPGCSPGWRPLLQGVRRGRVGFVGDDFIDHLLDVQKHSRPHRGCGITGQRHASRRLITGTPQAGYPTGTGLRPKRRSWRGGSAGAVATDVPSGATRSPRPISARRRVLDRCRGAGGQRRLIVGRGIVRQRRTPRRRVGPV